MTEIDGPCRCKDSDERRVSWNLTKRSLPPVVSLARGHVGLGDRFRALYGRAIVIEVRSVGKVSGFGRRR